MLRTAGTAAARSSTVAAALRSSSRATSTLPAEWLEKATKELKGADPIER